MNESSAMQEQHDSSDFPPWAIEPCRSLPDFTRDLDLDPLANSKGRQTFREAGAPGDAPDLGERGG
ncbi:hypothetical protein GCM10007868_11200 [Gluconobacter frateurii]|nr:hypothetical protein GCM10007868_11200 [Gluconobacter frateurii]